jgi:hypothetical protein
VRERLQTSQTTMSETIQRMATYDPNQISEILALNQQLWSFVQELLHNIQNQRNGQDALLQQQADLVQMPQPAEVHEDSDNFDSDKSACDEEKRTLGVVEVHIRI